MKQRVLLQTAMVLLAGLLPLWPAALPALVALVVALALFGPRTGGSLLNWDTPLPWAMLLYGWHVAGMGWSEDQGFGWFDLGIKASLLLLPLVAWRQGALGPEVARSAWRMFVLACTLLVGFLVVRALWRYGSEHWMLMQGMSIAGKPYYNHLFSSYFSEPLHPTYLAWYLQVALIAWSLGNIRRSTSRWIDLLVQGTLMAGIVLCASKMGWIVLALFLAYQAALRWKDRAWRLSFVGLSLAAATLFGMLCITIPGVRGKVTEAWQALQGTNAHTEDSSGARRLVWDAAIRLFEEAPLLGTGTGDIKNELLAVYAEEGYEYPLEHRLNAHSQFLQFAAALGLPGLLLALLMLLVPLIFAIRRRQHALVLFLLATLMHFSVESMLEVQAGVIGFATFALLFTWGRVKEEDGAPHIVLLTQYFPPETGAPQNRLYATALQLRDHGARVTVLTAMPNYPAMRVHEAYRGRLFMREERDGLEVLRAWLLVSPKRSLPWRLANYFSFVASSLVAGLLTLRRADVLLVESPPLFLGISAMVLARLKGAKLVFNVSDLWPESAVQLGLVKPGPMVDLSTWLELLCYRRSALVTGQTQGIVADIRRRCPDKTVEWIPNGVDVEAIAAVVPAEREQHGLSNDQLVLTYAGIIGHAQGLEVVLEAAHLLRDQDRVRFVLLGDGPERAALRKCADELALTNVLFVDPMPRAEALSLVAASDAAVVPLRDNPLFRGAIPSKLFEAQALGKPLLLGVDGEARELFIEQGGGGLYFTPEDPQALAVAVRELLADPGKARTLGEAGARYVRDQFDRKRIGDRLWSALRPLLRR